MWPDTGQGVSGPRARIVQGLLQAQGYRLTLDGIFGPNTAAAVREFQTQRGIGVDGIVGPHTMAALIQP
jgi:peptidoglycan hydrolase-like protein with peptidoglycan-binding domain